MNETNIKRLLDNLNEVSNGEKVIACLPDEYRERLLQQHNAYLDIDALQRKVKRMTELAQAKQVIFWEDLKALVEQADSASNRGLSIGV